MGATSGLRRRMVEHRGQSGHSEFTEHEPHDETDDRNEINEPQETGMNTNIRRSSLAAVMLITCAGHATVAPAADAQPAAPTAETKPAASAQAPSAARPIPPQPDFTKVPTLYTVGYAHLDTEWRWAYPQTIREYIPATMRRNFPLFEKYPGYVFNFTGSRRYEMMAEYYPEDFAKVKEYIKQGRWFPCGSSVDENDANVPSAESLVRQVLYGNQYFRNTFGVASDEYMLPDCFGFPAALPSVLNHCGVKGFSTQKLTWGVAVPMPFKVGVWNGPDGRGVIAALDPGNYVGEVMEDLSASDGWMKRIQNNGKVGGALVDYHYYGTGDQGGAPTERSVANVEKSLLNMGPLKIISGPADWMFNAFTPAMREKLPVYQGELLLTEHSAGSISSQAYMKRWNRKNELLADAAERASVLAMVLGTQAYPARKIEDAWTLVLGSQMHDILPGTSLPKAYEYAWNDEVLAGNLFSSTVVDSVSAVVGMMDTQGATKGEETRVVVYNPLATRRQDVVEISLGATAGQLAPGAAVSVTVVGPDGKSAPAQVLQVVPSEFAVRVAFVADVQPTSMTTFSVNMHVSGKRAEPKALESSSIEDDWFKVTLNADGDVASITDQRAKREVLRSPMRLGLHHEKPANWPAWNQDWADRQKPPTGFVDGPAKIEMVETGPARSALRVTRQAQGSTFVQTIRLDNSGRIEFINDIDWNTQERSLRAWFPLAVSNPKATYDIQAGVIERPNSNAKCFEYPVHQWFDLTDAKGDYGVTVMNDSKFASDKPDDSTVRLTMLYTPGVRGEYQDQATQDLGHHQIVFALQPHKGDWRDPANLPPGGTGPWQAARLNQPLQAFVVTAHPGPLGKAVSLASCESPHVMMTAMKKAEATTEIVVRLRELTGRNQSAVPVKFLAPVLSAREVDGQERTITTAAVKDGVLLADVHGYGLRAYAVTLGPVPTRGTPITSKSVPIVCDTDVASTDANRADGEMEAKFGSYPAEQLATLFARTDTLKPAGALADGKPNAISCNGQEIALPAGDFDTVRMLLASSNGDREGSFVIGPVEYAPIVRSWHGFVGQWDTRQWIGEVPEAAYKWTNEWGGLTPGYVHPERVEWYASHRHTKGGNAFYQYCYIYRQEFSIVPGAKSIVLPMDKSIKVFAIDIAKTSRGAVPARPLFDTLTSGPRDNSPRVIAPASPAKDGVTISIQPPLYWRAGALRYTLDGNDPTMASPTYKQPMLLHDTTIVKAAMFDGDGNRGPVGSTVVRVDDTTPPSVTRTECMYRAAVIRVWLSEPLDTPLAKGSYSAKLEPAIDIASVEAAADGLSLEVRLASPLEDREYTLTLAGFKDRASKGNAMPSTKLPIKPPSPILRIESVNPDQYGKSIRDERLPSKGSQPWTMNMLVRLKKQPDNRTVIAGFGTCEDKVDGQGRYFAKFSGGAHFWGRHCDASSKTALDLNRWQMLTATYDGQSIKLYKDGKLIGSTSGQLADDQPVLQFAPVDPWEHTRKFDGEIREFTVWPVALGADAVQGLVQTIKKPE